MKNSFVLLIAIVSIATAQLRGYGDRYDSIPTFNERQLHVLTNACRMAPAQYRDAYVGSSYQILLPASSPAVNPLYWNLSLNRSSHDHSVDMANNCGMQHNSCNGDTWSTRIKSYYTKSSYIGENIAGGTTTALASMKLWLLDSQTTTHSIPADLDANAGHRTNIMLGTYRELGCGYAYGPQQYRYFWTQDFGGGKPDYTNSIVGGFHFFMTTGNITFFANYWDSAGSAPDQISVVIENQPYAMSLAMGITSRGTYSFMQAKGTACRQYYFTATHGATTWRYPEYGVLVTSGEGACTRDYTPPESLAAVRFVLAPASAAQKFQIALLDANHLIVSGIITHGRPAAITISDLLGREICCECRVGQSDRTVSVIFTMGQPLPQGVYLGRVIFNDGYVATGRLVADR